MIIGTSITKLYHSDHQDIDLNILQHTSKWKGQKQRLEIKILEKYFFMKFFGDSSTKWATLNRLQSLDLNLDLLFFNLFVFQDLDISSSFSTVMTFRGYDRLWKTKRLGTYALLILLRCTYKYFNPLFLLSFCWLLLRFSSKKAKKVGNFTFLKKSDFIGKVSNLYLKYSF